MFDKTRDQMDNWRLDHPCAFWDAVIRSNPQTTNSGKVKRTGERFSWNGSDHPMAKIEPSSCWQYKPGDFLAVLPLKWDEILDEDEDNDNWAVPGAPIGGRSHPSDGNHNHDSEGQEDTQGSEKGPGKGKGTKDGKGKRKGKATEEGKGMRNGNSKWKGLRQTQTRRANWSRCF
jgi:hypothetical protein